jgi:hypothetical protein
MYAIVASPYYGTAMGRSGQERDENPEECSGKSCVVGFTVEQHRMRVQWHFFRVRGIQ